MNIMWDTGGPSSILVLAQVMYTAVEPCVRVVEKMQWSTLQLAVCTYVTV